MTFHSTVNKAEKSLIKTQIQTHKQQFCHVQNFIFSCSKQAEVNQHIKTAVKLILMNNRVCPKVYSAVEQAAKGDPESFTGGS